MLLHGPDLTNNLLGVLLRYIQHPIAVVGLCDIKAMFSQVFVDEQDQNAFRFLWFPDNDLDQSPVDYLMRYYSVVIIDRPTIRPGLAGTVPV